MAQPFGEYISYISNICKKKNHIIAEKKENGNSCIMQIKYFKKNSMPGDPVN